MRAFEEALEDSRGPVGTRPGDDRSTWVVVDRDPLDGHYFPAIVAQGRTWALADAARYATALLDVVEDACHDAAIVRLMMERLQQPQHYAVWFIEELRKDRAPYDDEATAPLRFRPFIGYKSLLPWVTLELDGENLGRWTPDDARGHAAHALAAPRAAELDAAIVRQLRAGFELTEKGAAAMVNDLMEHRDDHHRGERLASE